MNFKEELAARTARAEEVLARFLPPQEGPAKELADAMSYSLLAGGKRLRPVLMAETFAVFGGEGAVIEPFMAGMEMIHTHSLIHDDLPALDNDDLRRGRPTTHRVYGEAAAILAGDALLNYAYETMCRAFGMGHDTDAVARTLSLIAEKTGIRGMLGGQSVDVALEGKPIPADTLSYIYEKKTAALIEASMTAGAVLAGADEADTAVLLEAARKIGVAFQIRDDILDVEGDQAALGKPVHSDEKNNKTTYVTLYGLAEADRCVQKLSGEALALLSGLKADTSFLQELTRAMTTRRF
ncbi:MAG: polyprenyl synthetase family protein [Blautia sp.]|nr:polyprenyl synthetase family protein [Blautia sp.]